MISALLDPAFSGRLCLTLLHSLWQVATFAAIAWGCDRLLRKRSAERSYVLYTLTLTVSVAALPITWWCLAGENSTSQIAALQTKPVPTTISNPIAPGEPMQDEAHVMPGDVRPALSQNSVRPTNLPPADRRTEQPNAATSTIENAVWAQPNTATPESISLSTVPPNWLGIAPWLAAVYLTGVAVMLLRLAWSLRRNQLSRLATEVLADGPLVDLVGELSRCWKMRLTPVLMQVQDRIVPQVVGLFKPVILLPMSAVNSLSTEELGLILTHELAHIRRHDMWIHLMQRLSEIVLFFNPALWLLSHRISAVREYCCDDMTCQTAASLNQKFAMPQRCCELSKSQHRRLNHT